MTVLTTATSNYIRHVRITYRKDCLINYNQVKLRGNQIIFYLMRNTHDSQYPSNRIREYRFMFLVVVNAGVNEWHFHMI